MSFSIIDTSNAKTVATACLSSLLQEGRSKDMQPLTTLTMAVLLLSDNNKLIPHFGARVVACIIVKLVGVL